MNAKPALDLSKFIILWDDGLPYLWCSVCKGDERLPEPADLAATVRIAGAHACEDPQ